MSLGLAYREIGGVLAACLLVVGMAGCGGGGSLSTGPAEEPSVGPGAGAGGKGLPTSDATGKAAGASTPASSKTATPAAK